MKKLFTLLLTIGFIFVSCDIFTNNANESEIKSELNGHAMFNNSNDHSNISIEIKSNNSVVKSTSTDSSGLYFVDGLIQGNYTVTASSINSKEKTVNTSVTIDLRSTTASDLELTAIGHISGRITIDDSASGNLGVLVFVAGTSYVAMTNDFGDFIISDVPVGNDYSVVISKDYYMEVWDTVDVTTGNITNLNNYNLSSSNYVGNTGDSAYDIWLSLGNEGTEQDFIDSLQGSDGFSAYETWIALGNEGSELDFIISIQGVDGIDGTNGVDGLSTYEIWLELGNEGSELDFITSLQGETGDTGVDGLSAYEIWLSLGNVGTELEFLTSLQGETGDTGTDGLSAYEIWLLLGNTGTEQDFINSLIGADGDDGKSIIWKGSLAYPPESPDLNWAYYNLSDGISYVFNGTIWQILSKDGDVNITYNIGDIGPSGGYIFYDDLSDGVDDIPGYRYLEVAPVSTQWNDVEWGSYGIFNGINQKLIGFGKNNTRAIIRELIKLNETGTAAQLCNDLLFGGFNDWYLPSLEELELLYHNLHSLSIGDFSGIYRSSSEANSTNASIFVFDTGGSASVSKEFLASVRAIRAIRDYETDTTLSLNSDFTSSVSVIGGSFQQETDFQHTVSDFNIGRYEVTYELWYEVISWAVENGYSFENGGIEGNDGIIGAEPTSAKHEPVTTINWRDTIVWCNAYSEVNGRNPVYRNTSGNVIKDSRDINSEECDTTIPDWTNNGYRLPTEGEWHYAAIGGLLTNNYFYSGSNDIDEVAWYRYNSDLMTHNVGSKKANELGIYDMTGNIFEFCYDLYGEYPNESIDYRGDLSGDRRVERGGYWNNTAFYFSYVFERSNGIPGGNGYDGGGFRIAHY